ncbi:MAG: hypothetical protein ABSD88_20685 [Candidatus Korobacteraceae bacterium]|jgi:hypothetical protein
MEITTYRRHSADCPEKGDRYAPRCGCPLWFQFNWKWAVTVFDGNKLKRGHSLPRLPFRRTSRAV